MMRYSSCLPVKTPAVLMPVIVARAIEPLVTTGIIALATKMALDANWSFDNDRPRVNYHRLLAHRRRHDDRHRRTDGRLRNHHGRTSFAHRGWRLPRGARDDGRRLADWCWMTDDNARRHRDRQMDSNIEADAGLRGGSSSNQNCGQQ